MAGNLKKSFDSHAPKSPPLQGDENAKKFDAPARTAGRKQGPDTPYFSLIDRFSETAEGDLSLPYGRGAPGYVESLGIAACPYRPNTTTVKSMEGIGATPLSFYEVSGQAGAEKFHSCIAAATKTSPFGRAVEIKTVDDYKKQRLFLSEGGQVGFAIKSDGDIVSIFRSSTSNVDNASVSALTLAIQCGGRKLDAFDTILPAIYSKMGFTAIARIKWCDEAAPANWDKTLFNKFNHGEPDVVFMVFDPTRTDFYKPGEGVYVSNWDDGVAIQEEAIRQHSTFFAASQKNPAANKPTL